MTNTLTPTLSDSLLMRTLRKQSVSRRPIWLMRQAGRYLPEYREVRRQAGHFLNLVKTPEMACEVTLQPIRRFGFDASIIFSDILIIPDAMDVGLNFVEGEGPRIEHCIRSEADVQKLHTPTTDQFQYLFDACNLTRQNLPADVPLIGFCGAPFTLACYMIDGKGGQFWQSRQLRHSAPAVLHQLLQKLTTAVSDLLVGQIQAGCQVAMIFDSWGGLLPATEYEEFSLQYIRQIINHVQEKTAAPCIVFPRQCTLSLDAVSQTGAAAVGIDWQTSMQTARQFNTGDVALQGNLDPAVLLSDPETVQRQTTQILQSIPTNEHHIFNLGHGIDKTTPIENVEALVQTVKEFSTFS